jgi:hypothetical protein
MRKAATISLMLLVFFCGCASKPRGPIFDASRVQVEPSKALIYIIREDKFAGAANSWILADHGMNLAVISSNTYYAYSVEPGKVLFTAALIVSPLYAPTSVSRALFDAVTAAQAINTNSNLEFKALSTLDVKAGEIYYFKWAVESKFSVGLIPSLEKIDAAQGKAELEGKLLAGKYEG